MLTVVSMCVFAQSARAQRATWRDERFPYRRTVVAPGSAAPAKVIVADFFAHGQLRQDGSNLVVYGRREAVPFRILQVGPGDYCRVAIQAEAGTAEYHIYYGGDVSPGELRPRAWTAAEGLLLETRAWRPCDLKSLDSVRKAFNTAPRLGADYVPRVLHQHNPFAVEPAPFLSRYVGRLRLMVPGKVTFYTSSQDASFLLIDGEVVVAAPGLHPPAPLARTKGEVELEAGVHHFEYWHAASSDEAHMELAWRLPGLDKPAQISPSVFGDDWVAHVSATGLEHQTESYLPDFRMTVLGDAPTDEDGRSIMVRAQFFDATSQAITRNARYAWDFGDGLHSAEPGPAHVYLQPRMYPVTMTLERGGKTQSITNYVQIGPSTSIENARSAEGLGSYVQILEQYNAQQLEPAGLVQLVRVYLRLEDWARAVELGRTALSRKAAKHTDQTRGELIRLIGPAARFRLLEGKVAADLYRDAGLLIENREQRVMCALEAADAYLNDALLPAEAKPLLVYAEEQSAHLSSRGKSRMRRILGDWHARMGDGVAARAEYAKAAAAWGPPYSADEAKTRRDGHGQAAIALLRERDLWRLRAELERWQSEFPQGKQEGVWSLLMMNYWILQQRFPQAAAVASDLLIVNPNSPYADRLLYQLALCEGKQGNKPQAAAALHALATDYPHSPLAAKAKAQLERLEAGGELEYGD